MSSLVWVSGLLGVEVTRIVRGIADPNNDYRMETDHGMVWIGEVTNLITQDKFRGRLADACKVIMRVFSRSDWHDLVAAFMSLLEDESVGPESTYAGQVASWLIDFLSTHRPIVGSPVEIETESPFYSNSCLIIFTNSLRRWVGIHYSKFEGKQFGAMMTAFGATSDHVLAQRGGQRVRRSAWVIPPVCIPDGYQEPAPAGRKTRE